MGVPIACRRVHSAAAREGGCGVHPSARDWDTYKPQGGSFEKCSQPKRCYTLLRQCAAQHKLTRARASSAESSLRWGHANLLVELVLDVNDVHLHVLEHVRQSCSYA